MQMFRSGLDVERNTWGDLGPAWPYLGVNRKSFYSELEYWAKNMNRKRTRDLKFY